MIVKNCEVCHEPTAISPYRADSFRTCSHKCFAILKAGGKLPLEVVCKQCGKRETLFPSRANRLFCSRRCYADFMRTGVQPRDKETRRVSRRRSKAKMVLSKLGIIDVGDLNSDQWKSILVAFAGRCAYCGLKPQTLTMDHIVPVSKGGRHVAENVVPACTFCNQSKLNKMISPKFVPADFDEIVRILR